MTDEYLQCECMFEKQLLLYLLLLGALYIELCCMFLFLLIIYLKLSHILQFNQLK